MTRNEVEQLQANKGQLIAANTYWSTSRNEDIARIYISGHQNDSKQVAVLFQIECNIQDGQSSVSFADIAGYSDIPDEEEVLFDIGAIFRIESVTSETIDKAEVVVVQMKTTNEGQDVLEEYRKQNQKQMDSEGRTIMLCRILKRMGNCDQSRVLLERLLDHPNGEKLVHIHNRLGITYKDEHQYDRALEHFEQALKLTDFSDPSQRKYAAYIFHNKGLLCAKRRQLKEALELYEQAIAMLKKEISPPNIGIAQFLSSIGRIYLQQRKYEKALQYQQDALQMREECMSADHLVLTFSYADIGNIYQRLHKYEQALHYHKKALDLRQRYLLPNHHNTAYSLRDVGKIYFEMGKHEQARQYYFDSLEITEKWLSASFKRSIPSLLEAIAKTYDGSMPEEALRYRLKALEIQKSIQPS
ncbi:unnamed protein product [Adineta steineri]|uniref:ADP ribosyltransferase domain-containing protein n=1 Tax=Adineta steineri TaxID=433720 RepID=A0A819GP58_9BILA|nr:unnamed protein product [Adineta steineri]CAF3889567.1 unnamed protein product [Adineta steineri]